MKGTPVAALALCAALAGPACAGQFSIAPLRIDLQAQAATQLVSLTNTGARAARFLVRTAGWSTSESGGVILTPDGEMQAYPATFVVQPGASQPIRVSTRARAGESERTWRVILEELPSAAPPGESSATIDVLSVFSVPVFLAPRETRHVVNLSVRPAEGTAATIDVDNAGNVHEMLARVSLVALRGEQTLANEGAEGWYVLPGVRRSYRLSSPTPWCAAGADRFEIRLSDNDKQVLVRRPVAAHEVCP